MNKKILASIGLLICLIGAVISLLEENNSTSLPEFLKGTGIWLMLLGSSFSFIYSFFQRRKDN